MTQVFSAELFQPYQNSIFSINFDDGCFDLKLDKVEISNRSDDESYQSFSLCFSSVGELCLNQGSYKLEHPDLKENIIFIVPSNKTENGFEYHATFNIPKA